MDDDIGAHESLARVDNETMLQRLLCCGFVRACVWALGAVQGFVRACVWVLGAVLWFCASAYIFLCASRAGQGLMCASFL